MSTGKNAPRDGGTVRVTGRRIDMEDAAVVAGVGLVTIGAGLAWLPLAFVFLGLAILAVVRYGSFEA